MCVQHTISNKKEPSMHENYSESFGYLYLMPNMVWGGGGSGSGIYGSGLFS